MCFLSVIQTSLTYYACVAYVHSPLQLLYNRIVIKSHIAMKTIFGLDRRTATAVVLAHAEVYALELRYKLDVMYFPMPLPYSCI